MATHHLARQITVNFTYNGHRGGFRMAAGTAEALGIDKSHYGNGSREVSVEAGSYQRKLYPGGPSVTATVKEGTRMVPAGPQKGAAKTNKKLRLVKGNTHDTIYYTGSQTHALAWLKENTNVLLSNVVIYSGQGKLLSTIGWNPLN